MSAPRVTVAIPTFNRAQFLQEAIQSVLDQTCQEFEILISDNASTDNTGDVVAGFRDARIHYHRHPHNMGMTANWQFATSTPQTEFIAPLADDDLFLPEHLATALETLDRYPDVAYYTCPAQYFGDPIAAGFYRPATLADAATSEIYCAPREAVRFLGTDNPGPMNCMVVRKPALKDVFWGPPGYIPQDLLVMTQLMAQGGFVFGNRPMARFRVHASNASLLRQEKARLRFNLMAWWGVRWLADFLLMRAICTPVDIEQHGLTTPALERHVVPLVLSLGSFDSSPALRDVARRVFQTRTDADPISSRFRLARRLGFWIIPVAEKISQRRVGWRPPQLSK